MQTAAEIDAPYEPAPADVDRFRKQGYVKLKGVFSEQTIGSYGPHISSLVQRRSAQLSAKPMAERTTYEKAFLQVTNLWRDDDRVREFVFGKRLAGLAARLMGVGGVRLYHDQALYKEPGGGFTPWHADQYYWPLDSDNTCTAWVPLQATDAGMGPLSFAVGSHRLALGRDLKIGDESERKLKDALTNNEVPEDSGPFALGEVSFHYGWTFHHTGPNLSDRSRAVMTIIYMEDGIRLAELRRPEHVADRDAFMPGMKPGDIVATELNPLLYPAGA